MTDRDNSVSSVSGSSLDGATDAPEAAQGPRDREGLVPASGEWRPLDPRVLDYWRISASISFAVLLAIALAGGAALWIFTPTPLPAILGAWAFLAVLAYLEIGWFPLLKYREMGYRLTSDHLEYRHGVFWRVSVMIPLDRIQHADLQDGPLERRFGITTLEIYTAGTRNASHDIPGLAAQTGQQLRQRLIRAAHPGQG